MNGERIFVDTNILVYAHDADAGEKHATARSKVMSLWNQDLLPSISIQVLQEFYVNLVRKKIPGGHARLLVERYLYWNVIPNDEELLLQGIELARTGELSFWDALILAAARRAGASLLWSENFSAGRDYGDIRVINPLKAGS